ncbi:MAG: NAD(P)H-dependent oxidoreductase [Pseudomonadales bacterium]
MTRFEWFSDEKIGTAHLEELHVHYLVVIAHPLSESLTQQLAACAIDMLESDGHSTECLDLYASGFDPCLSAHERQQYASGVDSTSELSTYADQLRRAEGLVLIFPTWWFGMPAVLKGWFDRVWGTGVAFANDPHTGSIVPALLTLKEVRVITTLGAPSWVDKFVMRSPVKRILKRGIIGGCTVGCRFKMRSLYKADKVDRRAVEAFCRKLRPFLRN